MVEVLKQKPCYFFTTFFAIRWDEAFPNHESEPLDLRNNTPKLQHGAYCHILDLQ